MFVLKKENLEDLLNVWANVFEILAPQENDGQVMLLPYKDNNMTLDYINLAFPVKEFVFRQKEKLFSWSSENGSLKVKPNRKVENNKSILFGVRPCDAYGIAYMDKFFLEGVKDDIYEENRKDLLIAAVNCTHPGNNCFCSSAGTGPFAKSSFDVLFTPIDEVFLVETGSKKGEELIILGEELLSEAGKGLADEKDVLEAEVISKFNTILNTKNINKVMKDNFNNPIWEQLAKECVGCTGCTNVCPTCTCFNVVEEKTSACSGCRVRYWDSCQTSSFTRNAGEHNPRSNEARVRYRIYDKLKYIEEKFGMKGCTGCGRCINVCPASINMVNIVNEFANKDKMDVENKIGHLGHHAEHESCENVYTPQTAVITDIITETKNIKRFIMQYEDKTLHENFKFSGQFFEITVFGVGEIAISIPFSPSSKDSFDFCIKKAGKVTSAIHEMKIGDKVGLRGPFGKGFPFEELKGRDILIIGSGVGLAPVRTMILRVLENKKDFGKLVVIGSAISYEDLVYKEDLISWSGIDEVKVLYALSNPTSKVEAHVGYINDLLPDLGLDWKNTSAIICASPKRIKAVAKDLLSLGMKGTDILTSLETHMRCGIGKCGHCKVGNKYMCVDGPVFNYEEMLELPPEF